MKKPLKIIVPQHFECDFLGATITTGLYETGADVYETPYVKHLHGGIDKDYLLADGSLGLTGVPGFMSNSLPPNEKSEEEILEAAKDADFIVAHSTRKYALESLDRIISHLGRNPGNIVIVDGEDSDFINRQIIEKFRPLVLFKREMLRHHSLKFYADFCGVPTYPLPFGSFIRSLPNVDDQEKKWDFCLSLGYTHPCRLTLLKACLQANIPNSYIAGDGNNPLRQQYPHLREMLSWPEYMKMHAQAKVTASIRGFGRDTLNFWEKASWATALLYCPPNIYIPHPFIDRQHCIYFTEDCADVPEKIRWLLAEESYRQDIAAAGKRHCREFHTTKARAAYLLAIAAKILGGEKIDPEEFGL